MKENYFTKEGLDRQVRSVISKIAGKPGGLKSWSPVKGETGLLVTDMQDYFLDPSSHAFIPSAPAIIPNINRLLGIFKNLEKPVIFTRHIDTGKMDNMMVRWWNDRITMDSALSGITGELDTDGHMVILKNQYDAFCGTALDNVLRSRGITNLIVCGVMANLCCETTVRAAFTRGYWPALPVDATAAYSLAFHLATFRNLHFGFTPIITTNQVVQILSDGA